ncbi:hypothetical protein [Frigidibacter sp. ROC022]|uniref:hypothetical protein n=1 Tax=Frigidibacter sp. ROC022 TaxID=2971796 RepID=UPI00215AC96D|nr:hypothetical protein [Frigidibacter sp. ROC022]MCR8723332.1 hypothetical protein [Frigidibacter sp. ROC022]
MKKGVTPQLDSKWWAKNKAKTLLKTGIGDALRNYEVAQAKKDDQLVLKSLSVLKKAVANGVTKANPKLHAETIAALKKYPKLIEEQIKLANERIARDAAAAKGGGPAPKQKIGKDVVIWSIDVGVEVQKQFKPAWLESFKGYKMSLKLNDDILKLLEAEEDFVTPAFMVEDAQKVGKETVDAIVNAAKKVDAFTGTPQAVDKMRANFVKVAEGLIKTQAKKLAPIPATRWKTFVARHKQYKDYKIKAGFDVTLGILGTAGAAAGIVGSGGAGLVLGIVALVRSTTAVIKQIYDLALDADKVGKDLKKDCDTLLARYVDAQGQANKKTQGAAEVGGTVLKSILGTDAPFLATIPKAQANYELWDNKIAGVTVAGRAASKQINQALKGCDAAEKRIMKAQGKEAQKVYKTLVKLRKQLDEALNKTSDLMAKVSRFEANGPALQKTLKSLSNQNSDFAKIFDKVFPAVVNLTLSGASAGVGFKEAKTTLETFNTALGLANDIMSEGKDKLEEYLG